jgi:uncharacterized protein with PIN domain
MNSTKDFSKAGQASAAKLEVGDCIFYGLAVVPFFQPGVVENFLVR